MNDPEEIEVAIRFIGLDEFDVKQWPEYDASLTPGFTRLAERERQRKTDRIGVGIGIGVEKRIGMALGYEKTKSPRDRPVPGI